MTLRFRLVVSEIRDAAQVVVGWLDLDETVGVYAEPEAEDIDAPPP